MRMGLQAALLSSAAPALAATNVEFIYQQLKDWDLRPVSQYCVSKGLYSADEVGGALIEYRRYMALAMAYPKKSLSISAKVDDFWHAHILFTQDYSAMCQEISGAYVHHRPSILDGAVPERDITLELYRAHFGKPNPSFWSSGTDDPCCRPCETDPNE